ncbi:MAG: LysR family transcriptional regulator [Actinomycetota bacterium]
MRSLLRRVPQLQRLAVVDAVAATGSFTAAARELGISQPAVSRHVATIERQLEVTLFDRSTGSTTEAGRRLADATASAFAGLERAIDDIATSNDALVLAVQPTMATSWAVPHLDVIEESAGRSVRLLVFDRAAELEDGAWDVAVVPHSGLPAGLDGVELFVEVVRPCASPGFAAQHSLTADSEPADLAALPTLHIDSTERPSMSWPEWFAAFGIEDQRVPAVVYDGYPTVVQEALVGRGIVLGWRHLMGDLIERGLLTPVGPEVERAEMGHHVCWRRGQADRATHAVADALRDLIQPSAADAD